MPWVRFDDQYPIHRKVCGLSDIAFRLHFSAICWCVRNGTGDRCVICGSTDDLTLDHAYPWSLGGPDDEDNLQTLCRSCNSSKGARI